MKRLLTPLFCLLAAVLLQAQTKPELHILAVGVGQYANPNIRDLTYSAKDARDVAEQLKKQSSLYTLGRVEVLTDAQATRKGIRDALDRFSGISPNSLFILFFSGHGSHLAGEGYLVPHDFDPADETATSILKSELLTKLGRIGGNYMVLLDACHSGSFAKSLGKNVGVEHDNEVKLVTQELLETLSLEGKAQLVMGSSATSELSFECVSCQNGFFTQAVLDAFANMSVTDPNSKRTYQPDTDHDGFLSIDEFSNYLSENVRINTYLARQQDSRYKVQMTYASVKKVRNLRVFALGGTVPRPQPEAADRDHDGVPDSRDECPGEYGATASGCPDADNDGIPDHRDNCKYEAGLAAYNGCPAPSDRDRDGVADAADKCPDQYGDKRFQGCPDSDGDGIPDQEDDCPDIKGLASKNGCPDAANHMVRIEGGWFEMGDTFGDGESDEKPVHRVRVSTFLMDKNELSVGEFRKFIEATGYRTDAEKEGSSYVITSSGGWESKTGVNWRHDARGNVRPGSENNHPVIHVSWNDAVAYCNWRSKQEGLRPVYTISGSSVSADWSANGYRLPTEAEWEYAARSGGKEYKYAWGNGSPKGNIGDETARKTYSDWSVVWSGYSDGYVHTAPVGSFPQGDLGLNDMTGNVWEWCWDWYGSSYYGSSPSEDPKGPSSGSRRVLRGGSWSYGPALVRAARRGRGTPSYRDYYIGFRLSRTP